MKLGNGVLHGVENETGAFIFCRNRVKWARSSSHRERIEKIMSTTNEFGYDHVFRLAQNLSPEDRDRLLRELAEPKTEPMRPGPVEKTVTTIFDRRLNIKHYSLYVIH